MDLLRRAIFIGPRRDATVPGGSALTRAAALLSRHGGRAVSRSDPDYPRRLLDLGSPPPVVFLVGAWKLSEPCVAIVGARDGTDDGLDVARTLGARLAGEGAAVISGLALGIDAAAHEGALEAGGSSGAVLGTGIDRVYPRSNAELQSRLSRSLGVMSELLPGSSANAATFAARNRLLAALADVVVVVQGRASSGSLITAREAFRLGRPVAAVPWDSREPLAEAPHSLIRAGATLVRDADDVLALVGSKRDGSIKRFARWGPLAPRVPDSSMPRVSDDALRSRPTRESLDAAAPPAIDSRPMPPLTDAEARLHRALRERALPLDRLAEAAALTPSEFGSALLSLELHGLARREPGGLARKVRRR